LEDTYLDDYSNKRQCLQVDNEPPRTPEQHDTPEIDEEESSTYDIFPTHIHKRPEPNPFLARTKHDRDIEEEDDEEYNADQTIVGGKSTDWIIDGIRIRESLTQYQLEKNPPKTRPEYYDVIFFNDNNKDGFLETLDENIVEKMLDDEKLKPNEDIPSFEKNFALNFVRHMVKLIEDVNLLLDQMSEGTYIVHVLAPILSEFFIKNKQDWYASYGETCLKASAKDGNSQKADDQRRSPGKKIDTIISLREEDEEFSVTEVSGPPAKNDWSHFKGDRMKITKMLKTLINRFAELSPSSVNELIIYEFQLKYTEIYIMIPVLKFPLPKTWKDMAKAHETVMGLLKYE
ncbi:9265_t:CDS:2, partial [Funneliformis geosporum]